MTLYSLRATVPQAYEARTAMFEGKEYLIAPVVLLKEGVHCGSGGPLFYPADEIQRFAAAWNGRPVPLYHPENNGAPISCNQPEVIERQNVGHVFNVRYDPAIKGLRGEVWINKEKIQTLDPETYNALINGEIIEVSTGLFHDVIEQAGVWNGEEYEAVVTNIVPDHLALLPGARGACSVDDGCGIRANQQKGGDGVDVNVRSSARTPSYEGTETTSWSKVSKTLDAYIAGYYKHTGTTMPDDSRVEDMPGGMKRWIASKTLLGDAGADNTRDLLFFPVVNPSTNKLNEGALRAVISGRGSQANIPEEALSSAKRKAYQLLNKEFDAGLDIPENLEDVEQTNEGLFKKLFSLAKSLFTTSETDQIELVDKIRRMLDAMDRGNMYHYLESLYSGYFVYRVSGPQDTEYYRQDYEVDENGSVQFVGNPVPVTRQVSYEIMEDKGGDAGMTAQNQGCCLDLVNDLVANYGYEETDKEWLSKLDEKAIGRLIVLSAKKDELEQKDGGEVKTLEEYVGNAPDEFKPVLSAALEHYQTKKKELVEALKDNELIGLDEAQLESRSIDDLERFKKLVDLANTKKDDGKQTDNHGKGVYAGAEPGTNENKEEEPLIANVKIEIPKKE